MPVLDIYAPDFPHGSARGYESGCRTNSTCPNHGSAEWLTCAEAFTARKSDYTLAKQPRDLPIRRPGGPVSAERQMELAQAALDKKAKPAPPAKPLAVEPIPADLQADVDELPQQAEQPIRAKATRDVNNPAFPHGTNAGYQRGCRDKEACPGNDAHPSCTAATAAYTKSRKAARPSVGEILVEQLAETSGGEGSQAAAFEQAEVDPGRETEARSEGGDGAEPGNAAAGPSHETQATPTPPEPTIDETPTDQVLGELDDALAALRTAREELATSRQGTAVLREELANAEEAARLSARDARRHEQDAIEARQATQLLRDERTDLALADMIAAAPTSGTLTLTVEPTDTAGAHLTLKTTALAATQSLEIAAGVAAVLELDLATGAFGISVGSRRDQA